MKMVTTMISNRTTTVAPVRMVLPVQDRAERLTGDAVAQARQRMALCQRDEDLKTLLGVPAFLNAFVHALGCGVAQALAENDQFVQAVYTYDPSLNPDSESGDELPASGTVHLLVRIAKPSAALEAFIASLDKALTAKLRELPSNTFAQRTFVLDVNFLTEDDVRLGAGFAAMLSSVFAPPIKIWQR
jgi:hypothetical protein